ncbi:hypothetical protein D3C85_274540 [compost metagenome]
MSGYTKGPWRLDEGFINPEILDDTYHAIMAGAGFLGDEKNPAGFELTGCISTADARLISCAPELLEALEIALGSIKEICHERAIPVPTSTVRRCLEVIAKAKGEQA